MKKSFTKSLFVFLLAPAILLAFTSKPERANFSGQWSLNESKSELGDFAQFATRSMKVEQKDDNITISRTAASFDGGENTSVETLTFDGKEAESVLFGTSKRKASAKWSDDGKTLTTNFKLSLDFNGEVTEVTGTEVMTLGSDGKTLVSQINSSSSFGDLAIKGVYEKK
jgi:hypothetical protein